MKPAHRYDGAGSAVTDSRWTLGPWRGALVRLVGVPGADPDPASTLVRAGKIGHGRKVRQHQAATNHHDTEKGCA